MLLTPLYNLSYIDFIEITKSPSVAVTTWSMTHPTVSEIIMNTKVNEGKLNADRVFSYRGEDNWSDYENPAEALADMLDDDVLEVGNTFLTGIKRQPSPTQFIMDADEVLENYNLRIYDNYSGDFTDGNTGSDSVGDEAKAELNNFLKTWAEKHLNVSFWEIDHDEEIAVTQEMIDAFHANQPIPLPKFKLGGSHDN